MHKIIVYPIITGTKIRFGLTGDKKKRLEAIRLGRTLPAGLVRSSGIFLCNMGLASATTITLLNWIEYADFTVGYPFTDVSILLIMVLYRQCWATLSQHAQPAGGAYLNQ